MLAGYHRHTLSSAVAIIVVAALLAYSGLLLNDFIILDDNLYITENNRVRNGLSFDNILWAFNLNDKRGMYWHPLTWLSLMLDAQLFGLNPKAFHLVNLLLHVSAALVLFFLFNAMTRRVVPAMMVAILFAVHPLNVESVAWAAERKSLLALFFMLVSLYQYARYTSVGSKKAYSMMLAAFSCALLAKPTVVIMPLLLLLLDFWPLCRFNRDSAVKCILEKTPVCLLVACYLLLFFISLPPEPLTAGGSGVMEQLLLRGQGFIIGCAAYIKQLFWPVGLSIYHPVRSGYRIEEIITAVFLCVVLLYGALRCRERMPWFLFGLLWFFVSLLPTSGLIRVAMWPETADRHAYIPFIGLFVSLSYSADAELIRKYVFRIRWIRSVMVSMIVLCLITMTFQRVRVWRNAETLMADAYMYAPQNRYVLQAYGEALEASGNLDRAADMFSRSVAVAPEAPELHNKLGIVRTKQGRSAAAADSFARASRLDPANDTYRTNLGAALMESGRFADASSALTPVLLRSPGNIRVACMLAAMERQAGNESRALVYYSQARQYDPVEAENACSSISAMLEGLAEKQVKPPGIQ